MLAGSHQWWKVRFMVRFLHILNSLLKSVLMKICSDLGGFETMLMGRHTRSLGLATALNNSVPQQHSYPSSAMG